MDNIEFVTHISCPDCGADIARGIVNYANHQAECPERKIIHISNPLNKEEWNKLMENLRK